MTPPPIPIQSGLVYGPVASRRFGRSLGVNLLPVDRKVCNLGCVYCQYGDAASGRRAEQVELPAAELVLEAARRALERGAACDAITVAGNGEPTLHPDLPRIAAGLVELRDRHAPAVPLVLLTNGTRLQLPRVRDALRHFDWRVVKLDAGQEAGFRAVNRPSGASLASVVSGLLALGQTFTVQSLFFRGALDNATPEHLRSWARTLLRVRPVDVQVTTVERGTAVPGLEPVAARDLEAIAAGARRLGLSARAYPCTEEERFRLVPA